jgi:glycosyltransferase involved in cell wall biosynthesis
MAEPSPTNGYGDRSPAKQLANRTVQSVEPAPPVAASRRKRSRGISTKSVTVSLVIPVRNEARNIAWVLEQIADDVSEVILVDGNSSDATLITARSCRPDIKVVQQEGLGKGSALRTGFLAATGDIIVMIDADGSMAPQEIRHYLHFLTNGYDFVKGSRFIAGGGSLDITAFRRLGNRFLLAAFNGLYGAQLSDPCYRLCAFHHRYLEHLNLSADGFEIAPIHVLERYCANIGGVGN